MRLQQRALSYLHYFVQTSTVPSLGPLGPLGPRITFIPLLFNSLCDSSSISASSAVQLTRLSPTCGQMELCRSNCQPPPDPQTHIWYSPHPTPFHRRQWVSTSSRGGLCSRQYSPYWATLLDNTTGRSQALRLCKATRQPCFTPPWSFLIPQAMRSIYGLCEQQLSSSETG